MIEYQSTPDFYNEYISHHGILGQKWHVKNGPPYPLGSDVSTGSRLKKGAKGQGSISKKAKKLDKEMKKASNAKGSDTYYENDSKMAVKLDKEIRKAIKNGAEVIDLDNINKDSKTYKNRPDNLSELNLNKKSKEFYEKELENVKEPRQLKGDRLNEAATLGIKAMQELGDQDVQLDDDWKKWFVYEDQTIGLATVADLINQGKTKKQIKDLIDYADSLDYSRAYDGPVFELTEANRHSYPDIDSFIDACLKIKDNKKSQTKNVRPDNISELNLEKKSSNMSKKEFNKLMDDLESNKDLYKITNNKKSSVPDNKLTNFVDNLFNKANSIDYKKEASKMADKAKPYADKAKDGIDKAFDKANEMFPPKDKKPTSTTAESVIKENMNNLYDIEQKNTKKYGPMYVTNSEEFDKEIKRLSEKTGISEKALHDEYMMRYEDYDEKKQNKRKQNDQRNSSK